MSKSHYLSEAVLRHFYMNDSVTSPASIEVGLLTAVTDMESGTGVTEATYTNYARQTGLTFGNLQANGNGGGRQVSNTGTITFPQNTGSSQNVIAAGIWDVSGNLLNVVFLDTQAPIYVVLTDTSGDIFEHASHGLANDQRVRLEAVPGSGGLPTGASENTEYWVISTATDNFQLSASQGGGSLAITAGGECMVHPYDPVTINTNDTPEFAADALVIEED